jgi:ankyrin repeat protein
VTALIAAIKFGDNNRNHIIMSNTELSLNKAKDPIKLDINEGEDEIPFIDYILRKTECLDLDKECNGGDTALIVACRLGKAKIVDLLLRRGMYMKQLDCPRYLYMYVYTYIYIYAYIYSFTHIQIYIYT